MARAILCNGAPVLKLRLSAPIAAAWTADLEASSATALTGAVTISDGSNLWKGTVLQSGVVAGLSSATVVGGAGGLRKKVSAKSYVGVIARTVVNDILAEVGERLDTTAATAPALRVTLNHWTRVTSDDADGTAGAQLSSLLAAIGATWRVLPSGAVWIGSPKFPAAKPEGVFELDREPSRQRVHVALDALNLLPDSTVGSDRVGDVEYRVAESGIHATYWLEAA